MTDTVFRQTIAPPVAKESELKSNTPDSTSITTVETPYLDYQSDHSRPYLVDHFNLGDHWNDYDGGFPKEIGIMENYIEGKIKVGEIANTQNAVKEYIKGIEKLNNLTKEERAVVKIETITAYIEFLMKTEKTKHNLRRYNAY